ncbi:PucR family transcriptional regulator [Streptomyces sp. NBC_00073]|uniref:PucR family transcriptional regulator n=1 Tax=Streptomyces sp. NBC_00073 TaxID=2975640 RepID=UPI00324FBBB7
MTKPAGTDIPPTPAVALGALLADRGLELRLVAGPERAEVHGVHASEMADPSPYLLGGELLLTAGAGLTAPEAGPSGAGGPGGAVGPGDAGDAGGIAGDADAAADAYVRRLVGSGVAALGFGVAPLHAEVPPELVRASARHGLPLLEVPPQTRFTAVARAVWRLMAEARTRELRRVTEAQQALAAAAARPDPVPAVLRRLAASLGGWAALLAPPSPAGAAGAAGAAVAAGPAVAAGAAGVTRAARATGPTGAPGSAGTAGATGPAGFAGAAGATGPTGAAGVAGVTRAAGTTGPAGASGSAGAAGATGPAGFAGAAGATGPAGAAGVTRAAGATGPAGASGSAGAAGSTGPAGVAGAASPPKVGADVGGIGAAGAVRAAAAARVGGGATGAAEVRGGAEAVGGGVGVGRRVVSACAGPAPSAEAMAALVALAGRVAPDAAATATATADGVQLAAYALGGGQALGVATAERAPGDHTIASVAAVLLALLTADRPAGAEAASLARLLLGGSPAGALGGPGPWYAVHARGGADPRALAAALGTVLLDPDGPAVRLLTDRDPAPQHGWRLGVSAPAGPDALAAADAQARRALDRAEAARTPLARHTDPGFAGLVGEAEARAHAEALLGPLSPALRETLRAWLSHHGSWDRSAAALGLHRNTVRQRVARAANLLDRDLDDPDIRMELWFALTRTPES